MQCDLCGRINGHIEGCPNHEPPRARHICSACGMGIYGGDEYLINEDGDYRHYDCFNGAKDLLEWLGYKIKIMEGQF